MYSGALSGTVKMLATDELDQPYYRLRLSSIQEAVVHVTRSHYHFFFIRQKYKSAKYGSVI
jgi:hypothetical protein